MSDRNKVRLAHELLDEVNAREDLTPRQVGVLRSFLPELPKQKTLEEIAHDVYDAWGAAYGNDWADDVFGELETWLDELHKQLKGLKDTSAVFPALPAGMRLADHAVYGRVVVSPKPNDIGQYKIFHLDDSYVSGADASYAGADALTFIDAAPEFAQALAEETWEYSLQILRGDEWEHASDIIPGVDEWFPSKYVADSIMDAAQKSGYVCRLVRRRVSPPEVINE